MTGEHAEPATLAPPSPPGARWTEAERLAALYETRLLDTPPEPEFDAVVALAARLFAVPIASMTLIDERRQWFKSLVGIEHDEDPIEESICATVIDLNGPLVLRDVRDDTRFADRIHVRTGTVVAYAGVPIAGRDGLPLGVLCVVDHGPRDFEPGEVRLLESLARVIGDELDLRRRDAQVGIDSSSARRTVEDLRLALAADGLELRFQPVTDLASGRCQRVEALVRWTHPRLGLLGPGDFLPLAESVGLGHRVDRWVLRQSVQLVAQLRAGSAATRGLGLAVNVGLGPGVDLTWADEVAAVLSATGLPPRALTLEVTERGLDGAGPAVREALEWLATLGCRISIDDIGTGTSSLARLAELPATEIKIDRSFVQSMAHDRRRAAVVGAMARLGRELEMEVVAEGVESADVARRVADLGCTSGQGFFWSPPVELPALLDVLGGRADPWGRPATGPSSG
jgi:EAL domain-containing protein (putative c-di-GMP-specific phosphodiesterase class I)